MARQNKQGLDYFPLNVFMDDKIELLEAEHGLSGFAIYIKLLQKIYSEGYFYYLGQDELLLTSKRINVDINLINAVVNSCIRRNLFNNVLFEKYKILTSSGIQKRFIEATLRRKEIEIIRQYWLDVDYDSDRVRIIDVDINEENVDINKQSKVKKSKEKKKESNNDLQKPEDVTQKSWDDWMLIKKGKGQIMTASALDKFIALAKDFGFTTQALIDYCIVKSWASATKKYLENDGYKPVKTDQEDEFEFAPADQR